MVAISSEPATLDPVKGWGHGNMPLIQSTLIKYDSDMGFEKDLAVSYQLDESGPVWTFTLRGDARFTDGEAVTASDVAFTFVFLMVFAVMLGWFPIGMRDSEVTIWKRLHHLVLPAFTLSLMSFSNIARHTRQKMIEVMDSEYVLFARARGEGRRTLFWRHGVRNTVLPAVTLQFASFAELFGGSVLAESVFSYPGLGSAAAAAGPGSDGADGRYRRDALDEPGAADAGRGDAAAPPALYCSLPPSGQIGRMDHGTSFAAASGAAGSAAGYMIWGTVGHVSCQDDDRFLDEQICMMSMCYSLPQDFGSAAISMICSMTCCQTSTSAAGGTRIFWTVRAILRSSRSAS